MAIDKDQLSTIQKLIGQRLLAQLEDLEKPTRASMVNSAISYLKLFPQFVDKLSTVDSTQEISDALRATLAKCGPLPFLPPSEYDNENTDDDSSESEE
jgi:hypothetical protein